MTQDKAIWLVWQVSTDQTRKSFTKSNIQEARQGHSEGFQHVSVQIAGLLANVASKQPKWELEADCA